MSDVSQKPYLEPHLAIYDIQSIVVGISYNIEVKVLYSICI